MSLHTHTSHTSHMQHTSHNINNFSNNIDYNKNDDDDDIHTHHSKKTHSYIDQENEYEEDENTDEIDKINENDDLIETIDIRSYKNKKKTNIFKKSNLLFLNNGWNENNEKIIINIGEHAASYKWMHEKNSRINKRINDFISILLILLSTILSADTILSSSSSSSNSSNTNETIAILTKVIIYIINILSVLQQFLKLEENSNLHMEYANAFIRLYHDIQQQMSTYRVHRLNASKYISDCIKKYDSLIIKGPKISSFIINKFKKKFNQSEISLPDIVDNIQKIEIVSEPVSIASKNLVQIKDNQSNKEKNIKQNIKQNMNTTQLRTMNNIFKIDGDFSESDVNDLNPSELRRLKKKFLKAKSEFEYKRFLEHNLDF